MRFQYYEASTWLRSDRLFDLFADVPYFLRCMCPSRLLLRGDDEGFDVLHRLFEPLRGLIQVVDDRFRLSPLDGALRLRGRCDGRGDLFHGLLSLSRRLTRLG